MIANQVIALRDGFYAVVNGKLYGPWPMREYAEAGLQVEQRRQVCPDCKLSNADSHYDAEHQICPLVRRAWSEAK